MLILGHIWKCRAALVFGCTLAGLQLEGQDLADTSYITTYQKGLVGRFYFSQKYTTVTMKGYEGEKFRYRPNTSFNIGVGATYSAFTLNLAYKAPFWNNDKEKGKTKYLDLQCHIYPRHWMIDFYGQNYKGYYAFPKEGAHAEPEFYYYRPDVRVNLYGLSMYRLFNGNRVSLRASFLQTEWQRKSAGSWLLGAEIHGGVLQGDSALIPAALLFEYPQAGVKKMILGQWGPGGGYGYNLVLGEHLFLTALAIVNFNIGLAKEEGTERDDLRFTFSPNLQFKAAIGYNGPHWIITFTNTPNLLAVRNRGWNDPYIFSTGNFRLNFAYRFVPGPRLGKKLQILDLGK